MRPATVVMQPERKSKRSCPAGTGAENQEKTTCLDENFPVYPAVPNFISPKVLVKQIIVDKSKSLQVH
jgi:hypothetical protein